MTLCAFNDPMSFDDLYMRASYILDISAGFRLPPKAITTTHDKLSR